MASPILVFSIYVDNQLRSQHELHKPLVKVGMHPDADLYIDDPYTSKMHAMIEARGLHDVTLIDLGNDPPVYVDGRPQLQSKLQTGSRLQIGTTTIVLDAIREDTAAAAPEPPAAPNFTTTAPNNPFAAADAPDPFASAEAAAPIEVDGEASYQMLRSGPEVNPDEVELPDATAVEVTLVWGNNILTTRHLTPPRSFYVGEETSKNREVDFFLPAEKLGTTRMPVVLVSASGLFAVIPNGARGKVTINGNEVTLDALRAEVEPCPELAGAVQWPLPAHAEVRIEMGGIGTVVRTVRAGKPVPHSVGVDWNSASYFGASFLGVGALLGAMAFFMPPMGLTEGEGTLQDQLILLQQYQDALAEREEEEQENVSDENTTENEGGTGERAQDAEGAMGDAETTQKNHRYAVKGDPQNPDPHLARERSLREAAEFGLIGMLNSGVAGDPDAPTAPWGRDTSLGLDDRSALGNMWGDEIGESSGMGGFGLSGLSEGGGGLGFGIGLGSIGTLGHGAGTGTEQGFGRSGGRLQGTHETKVLKMRQGQMVLSGRLPREVIQRIVRQNFGRFRLCYEKGLSKNPNLQGRIVARFVIDRNGAVSNVANGGSSLPDSAVVNCVIGAYYGLSFPKPEGGIVTISYPISFSPG